LGGARQRGRRDDPLSQGRLLVRGRQRARQAARLHALRRRRSGLSRAVREGRGGRLSGVQGRLITIPGGGIARAPAPFSWPERRTAMPAKSAAQQKAAGAALSAKRGDTPKSKLKGASKQMADSMSEKQLEEFAHTKRKGKPEHA